MISRLSKRGSNNEIIHDTYRRFFQEGKFAYRAFFTLLAASAACNIDISITKLNEQERYDLMVKFLRETIKLIENEPAKFD